jgi:hypothetical protein
MDYNPQPKDLSSELVGGYVVATSLILIVLIIITLAFLLYFYLTAQRISSIEMNCYKNGVPVNCSEMK